MPASQSSNLPDIPKLLSLADRQAQAASERFVLPFSLQVWRGSAGNWQGAGVGSSIDFQDHRSYFAGDDPRHINWNAYARTGHYSMKLYREEVSPQVDLFFDASHSMFFETPKALRSLELLYLAIHSARRAGASLRAWVAGSSEGPPEPLDLDQLLALRWQPQELAQLPESDAPAPSQKWNRAPVRPHALRVFISDLLFPGAPESHLSPQVFSNHAPSVLLCPFLRSEENPAWLGNVDLRDCESRAHRQQRFSKKQLDAYHQKYQAHFESWRDFARRRGLRLARVCADEVLPQALLAEPVSTHALELCN